LIFYCSSIVQQQYCLGLVVHLMIHFNFQ